MGAVLVGADIVKSHLLFSATCLGLEEDCFAVTALGARMIFGSRQCWIRNDVRNDVRQFTGMWRKKNKLIKILVRFMKLLRR
jgi:hypothetical protein